QLESEELAAEVPFEHQPLATLEKHLFGGKVVQQLVHIVERAFRRQKLARRYVQKSHTAGTLAEVYGSQKVVLPVVQHIVVDGDSRRHQLRDASLYEFLCQLRVLQLVADGHALAGTYQLGQIGVECMMRKARHF